MSAVPVRRRTGGKIKLVAASLTLAGLTIWAYWGVWDCPFVHFDDGSYVFDNPQVLTGPTRANVRWAWTTFRLSNWHPLTWLSYQFDVGLYGPGPRGFHITNLVWHVGNTLLVLRLCRRFWSSRWPGVLVAALFAIHPQHVESVAWISERKDVLSTFFGLLALSGYCRYADRPSAGRYLAITVAYLLSLLAKPTLVTFPFLLLVFDWWPLRRLTASESEGTTTKRSPSWRTLVFEKLPWIAISLGSCSMTILAQRGGGAMQDLDELGFGYRLSNALAGYVFYITKAIWPTNLIVFYPPPSAYPLGETLVRAAILLCISAAAFSLRKRRPYVLFGWLWFLGTLVPVIGLLQVGAQAYADRYSYLPMIGLSIMAAGAMVDLSRIAVAGRGLAIAMSAAAVAACLHLTPRQLDFWRDSKSLWQHTLAVTPTNFCAHRHMAHLLSKEDRLDEAIEHAKASAVEWPYNISYVHLAELLVRAERFDQAIEEYERAVRAQPADANSHLMLGNLLMQKKRPADALQQFEEAIAWRSGWGDAYNGLATAKAMTGDHTGALKAFAEAVNAEPENATFHNNLAAQLARTGDATEALARFEKALRLDPHYAEAMNNRGNVLASLQRWAEATAAYRDAIEQNPKDARYRFNLAMALHERGDIESSARQYASAVRQDPRWPRRAAEKAWELATAADAWRRDGPTAVRLALEACQAIDPPPPAALDALAAAYAEVGRFADAVQSAEQLLERLNAEGDAERVSEIERHLQSYRRNEPFRRTEDE